MVSAFLGEVLQYAITRFGVKFSNLPEQRVNSNKSDFVRWVIKFKNFWCVEKDKSNRHNYIYSVVEISIYKTFFLYRKRQEQ